MTKDIRAQIAELLATTVADMWTDEDGDLAFREGKVVVSVSVDESQDWPVVVLSTITNTDLPRIGALYKYAAEHAFDRQFTALTVATEPGEPVADVILGWEIIADTLQPDVLAWAVGFFVGQANDVADEVHTLFGGDLPGTELVVDEAEGEAPSELGRLSDRAGKRWRKHVDHITRRLERLLDHPEEEFVVIEVEGGDGVYLQLAPTDDGLSVRYEAVGEAHLPHPETTGKGLEKRLVACGWTAPDRAEGAEDGGNYYRYLPLPFDVAAVAEDAAYTLDEGYRVKPGARIAIHGKVGRKTRS